MLLNAAGSAIAAARDLLQSRCVSRREALARLGGICGREEVAKPAGIQGTDGDALPQSAIHQRIHLLRVRAAQESAGDERIRSFLMPAFCP
jgi:hypothetical protein